MELGHGEGTVLIVCSGSADNFNLEDFYGAGYLVSLFAPREGAHQFTDAAVAARPLHDHSDAMECLPASRVGRMMLSRGLQHEGRFAAQKRCFVVVARLECGSL